MGSLVSNKHSMSLARIAFLLVVGLLFVPTFPVESDAGKNRVTRAIEKNDRDGNGKISRGEWKKSKDIFNAIDADGDGFLNLGESRARFGGGNTKETKISSTPTANGIIGSTRKGSCH